MTTDDTDHTPDAPRPGVAVPGTMARSRSTEQAEPGRALLSPDTQRDQGGAGERELTDAEFSAFYRAHVKPLMAFLMRQGASTAEAADIAQETMVRAYTGWKDIREPRPWAYKVAANTLAARARARREMLVETVPEPSALLPDPDAATEWEMRHLTLWMLSQLPHRQKQVLAWTLDGFGTAEIAEHLGIAPGAVRAALMKARAAVTPHLTGHRRTAPDRGTKGGDRNVPMTHGPGRDPGAGHDGGDGPHDSTWKEA
ncbi:RNA polymerase sigma factor [Streptodolium elevatio]